MFRVCDRSSSFLNTSSSIVVIGRKVVKKPAASLHVPGISMIQKEYNSGIGRPVKVVCGVETLKVTTTNNWHMHNCHSSGACTTS